MSSCSEVELTLKEGIQRSMVVNVLDMSTIRDQTPILTCLLILFTGELGETPLVRDQQFLTTRELVLGTAKSLNDHSLVGILATNRNQHLSNIHTGNRANRLTKGTTHTSLQTIGTGTGQHFVDTQDVEGMYTDTHVERVLAGVLGNVLVGTDTGGFQGFTANLFTLIRQEMDTEGKLVGGSLLATQIKDANLGV